MITHIATALFEEGLTQHQLPLVPFTAWVDKLAEVGQRTRGVERKALPSLKLLPQYRSYAKMDETLRDLMQKGIEAGGMSTWLAHSEALEASITMQEQKPLNLQDAKRWIGYWKSRGMFIEIAQL